MSLLNEIFGGLIGGSLPTIRGRKLATPGEKNTPVFYFQIIHPDAISGGNFAHGRNRSTTSRRSSMTFSVTAIEAAMLPGQIEADARKRSDAAGGLLFTAAEIGEFNEINAELGRPAWDIGKLARPEEVFFTAKAPRSPRDAKTRGWLEMNRNAEPAKIAERVRGG
jgi:L-2-hydroxycarboxylate dehydrogenase (NAD+)